MARATTTLDPAYIASFFTEVPEVESVYVAGREMGSLEVINVVNDEDHTVYRRIIARENALLGALPEVDFDFHVMARRNRPVAEMLGEASPTWQRKVPGAGSLQTP